MALNAAKSYFVWSDGTWGEPEGGSRNGYPVVHAIFPQKMIDTSPGIQKGNSEWQVRVVPVEMGEAPGLESGIYLLDEQTHEWAFIGKGKLYQHFTGQQYYGGDR